MGKWKGRDFDCIKNINNVNFMMLFNKTIAYLILLLSLPLPCVNDYPGKSGKTFYEFKEAGIFICTEGTTLSISKYLETLYDDSYVNRGINCNLSIRLSVGQIDLFFPKEFKNYVCVSDRESVIEGIKSSADLLAIRMPYSFKKPRWNINYLKLQINAPEMTISFFDEHQECQILKPIEKTTILSILDNNKNIGYKDPDKKVLEKLFKVENELTKKPDVSLLNIEDNKDVVISINGDTLKLQPLIIRDGLFPPFYSYPKVYILNNMPDLLFVTSDGYVYHRCNRYHIVDFNPSAFNIEPENIFCIAITNHI